MSGLPALLAALGVALSMASCTKTTPPDTAGGATRSSAANDGSTIPKGAQWTLLCTMISGPGHVERAKRIKDDLMRVPGMQQWFLVHKPDETEVYYGYYREVQPETADGRRAQADRRRVEALAAPDQTRLFPRVGFVPLPTPDPAAPAEWNLANADGFWTLEIAAYSGSPQRKEYAVDAVREARAQGIEAYYIHGDSISSVCIGTWPQNAVIEPDETRPLTADQDQPVLVVTPGVPAPTGPVYDQQGREMKVVRQGVQIVDPTLKATMAKYPGHAVNGEMHYTRARDPQTGELVEHPSSPSFLVKIPKAKAPAPSLLSDSDNTSDPERPLLISPAPAPTPGTGRLRSIGDR